MRPRRDATSSSVSLPLLTARAVEPVRCARARSTPASSISTPTTSNPERASTSAIPAPIVPRPTTPILLNSRATAVLSPYRNPVTIVPSGSVRSADGGKRMAMYDAVGSEDVADRLVQQVGERQDDLALA